LACLILAAVSSIAVAQAGHLDPIFANKGIFLENFNGSTGTGTAVALQSDGKIVAAGTMGNSSRGVVFASTLMAPLTAALGRPE